MLESIKNHPKTTISGIASILTGIFLVVQGNTAEGVVAISAGITGLFAKDGDKE